jgi:uncharacterized membrane protein YjjP (DUF1212 family)
MEAPADAPDPGEVRELVVQLGTAMLAAGDSVDAVSSTLSGILRAYGLSKSAVIVLPTVLWVETGHGPTARVELGSKVESSLRMDQVSALYMLVGTVARETPAPAAAIANLRALRTARPRFAWPVRVLGHAFLTVGLALLLQPTFSTLIACFLLGLLVGLVKVAPRDTLQLVIPAATALVATAIVLVAAERFHLENPIRVLVPPLVTFLPGGVITIATVELAGGEMVAGASRLVSGIVQLLLLGFGVLAGASLVGAPLAILQDVPVDSVVWWTPWLGVLVFALGIHLHFCTPTASMPWVVLVLFAAFAGQELGAAWFGGELSGFFGALAMTPLVLWLDHRPDRPPKLVTFLPAFWLLVPGATGLIGITEVVGVDAHVGDDALRLVTVTVISIALGVLVGTAGYRSLVARGQEFRRMVAP